MLGFLPTRACRPGTPGATTFLSPLSGTFQLRLGQLPKVTVTRQLPDREPTVVDGLRDLHHVGHTQWNPQLRAARSRPQHDLPEFTYQGYLELHCDGLVEFGWSSVRPHAASSSAPGIDPADLAPSSYQQPARPPGRRPVPTDLRVPSRRPAHTPHRPSLAPHPPPGLASPASRGRAPLHWRRPPEPPGQRRITTCTTDT